MREAPPEALPPRVMKQVWESALSGDLPAYTLNAVLFHVVEAAMAPPPYASVGGDRRRAGRHGEQDHAVRADGEAAGAKKAVDAKYLML